MRKTKLFFYLFILTSNAFLTSLAAEDWCTKKYVYQETTGSRIDTCVCVIKKVSDGFLFTVDYTDEVYRFKTNLTYSAEQCDISKTNSSNSLRVERQGKKLLLNDKDGSDVKVGDNPWYQTSFSLAGFAQSTEKKTTFYQATIYEDGEKKRKVNGSAIKMVAIKEKMETLKVDSRNIETVKVTITLPGFRSMFWKITYWYRLSDGAVVQYKDVRGGPGTPKTHGILIREEMN